MNKPACTELGHEKRAKANGVRYCYTCLKANAGKYHMVPRVEPRTNPAKAAPYTWDK